MTPVPETIGSDISTSRLSRSIIFNEGHVAGYNQSKVDLGIMSQEEADAILIKLREPCRGAE